MKTRVGLKYFVHGCLCKRICASTSPQATLYLIFFNNYDINLEPEIRGTKLQKSVKIGLT